MAISTYAELKTAVANWLHRTDLTTVIPDFISLGEARIRHDVRCRAMEQEYAGTLTTTELALPTRFAEVRRVVVANRVQNYLEPEAFKRYDTSMTDAYTVIGTNFVFQYSTSDYAIDYYQWFAPLAEDADTNWLLTNFPEIYLNAALFEAADYISGDGSKWLAKYKIGCDRLKNTERNFGARLVVRPDIANGYLP